MAKQSVAIGIEINPKLVGALFTDRVAGTLRVFCFYLNGETSQFDVPDEGNRESLDGLLAMLNTEENCTSLILDEVVQGRVYVKTGEKHWLYTILRWPGQVPPPLNADIADLPWQVVWRSHESEVLRYVQRNGSERCIAVRSLINENDALRLVRAAKAFTAPVSIPRKQPVRLANVYACLVLLLLGATLGTTIFYASRQPKTVAATTPPVEQARAASDTGEFYLLCNHKISGPYPAKIVAELNTGGLLNDETLCRPANSTEWGRVAAAFSQVARN
jgi:hypothetical protein